jgi:hypothetical protein
MRRRSVWVLLTVLLVGAAIAASAALRHDAGVDPTQASRPHYGNDPSMNWEHPLINGTPVESLAAAGSNVTFTPVEPSTLGDPTAIWETDSAAAGPDERLVVLVYDKTPYGPLWVSESHSTATGIGPMLVKGCITDSGCEADRVQLVTLADGSQASVQRQESNDAQNAVWDENGVTYAIRGSNSLSFEEAIALANDVAKAADSASAS